MSSSPMNPRPGVVYAQGSEPEANRLLVFERAPDGTLIPSGAHETGGGGGGIPHLTSQGSVMLSAGAFPSRTVSCPRTPTRRRPDSLPTARRSC